MRRSLHIRGLIPAAVVVSLVAAVSGRAQSGTDVLTGNYGNARTSANLGETILTPATVSAATFGRLFSLFVDGQVVAQPLVVRGVSIVGKGAHNVLFVATHHNTVYAFDADAPAPPLWSVNLGPSVPNHAYDSPRDIYGPYIDVEPENGILGTPVIDAVSGTLYAVAATLENGAFYYRLHALAIASGAERFGAPSTIGGQVAGTAEDSVNGVLAFDALRQLQRPALLLVNGVVYVAFGSHADTPPYHGWAMGYRADNVQVQTGIFNTTPNGGGGAIWQSGRGLSADEAGNIYAATGNGDADGVSAFSNSVLRLKPSSLGLADWFIPFNAATLNGQDADVGTGGTLLIPGTNLLIAPSKAGSVYVLDKTALGHTAASDGQILQRLTAPAFGVFNGAVWNRPDGSILYLHPENLPVSSWTLTGLRFASTTPSQGSAAFASPFQGMGLSANGVQEGSGILWVTEPVAKKTPTTFQLAAYDADHLGHRLWDSDMTAGDAPGSFSKYASPTVANGKVYVPGASNRLVVYGLVDRSAGAGGVPFVTGVVNGASYANAAVAPGEIVTLVGENLGPTTLVSGSFDAAGQFVRQVGGTRVMFNGVSGPVVYASSNAVAAVVPYEVAGAGQVDVQVLAGTVSSPVYAFPVAGVAPGVFSLNTTGSGPGAIVNQDLGVNSLSHPAAVGSVVSVYATGGGVTSPSAVTGGAGVFSQVVAPVSVTVGGKVARVVYAGSAPTLLAGVLQINVEVPVGVSGSVPVVITVGGVVSQGTVSMSVQ